MLIRKGPMIGRAMLAQILLAAVVFPLLVRGVRSSLCGKSTRAMPARCIPVSTIIQYFVTNRHNARRENGVLPTTRLDMTCDPVHVAKSISPETEDVGWNEGLDENERGAC